MIVQRTLLDTIQPFINRPEYLAIIGPRQSGKTTFLHILEDRLLDSDEVEDGDIHTISFEDRTLLHQFEKAPRQFVRSYTNADTRTRTYLMIDEFQYAEKGGQKLKLVFDQIQNVKIIITGSSSLDIKANVSKYMVGRILTFHLHPFSFSEALRASNKRMFKAHQNRRTALTEFLSAERIIRPESGEDVFHEELDPHFEQYCIWGGYPAVVLAKTETEKRKLLRDIYNAYVLADIKTLLQLATEDNLLQLSKHLAVQTGNIVVFNNLCNASNLNHRQLKKHLNILEETFVCQRLNPFFRNKQKELCKNPKIYFVDLGFRNNLVEHFGQLDQRPNAGAVVENAVFIHLHERGRQTGSLHFWRKKSGPEVDFVIERGEHVLPIEVKYQNFTSPDVPRGLRSFIHTFHPAKAVVLTRNFWGNCDYEETNVLFAPVYYA